MYCTLAHPLYDVADIVKMAREHFEGEVEGILTTSSRVFEHQLMVATTNQLYDNGREFIAVCRAEPQLVEVGRGIYEKEPQGRLLGYCWFDRGGYATYSTEEISNAKFHHVDMSLPAKTRVRLINEMIDQHILWASVWKIPVVCSCSIRGDYDAFMRIHKKRGFAVHGSYAWIRTDKGVELIHGRNGKEGGKEGA